MTLQFITKVIVSSDVVWGFVVVKIIRCPIQVLSNILSNWNIVREVHIGTCVQGYLVNLVARSTADIAKHISMNARAEAFHTGDVRTHIQ